MCACVCVCVGRGRAYQQMPQEAFDLQRHSWPHYYCRMIRYILIFAGRELQCIRGMSAACQKHLYCDM